MATEATPPTLPSDARQATLSTVIAEAISAGLKLETDQQRRDEIVDNYRKAFAGFSEEELAILDGVILTPVEPEGR